MIKLTKGQELPLATEDGQPLTRLQLGLGWDKSKTAGFMGTVSDDSIGVTVHYPVITGPRVHVVAAGGLALHAITIDGALDANAVNDRRYDPAARLGVTANYEVGRNLDIGLGVSADALLRRQRYASGTEPVLVVPRVQLTTGLIVTFRVM